MRHCFALVWVSAVAVACGGRTLLDPGENDADGSGSAGTASLPGDPGSGASDPGVDPGGPSGTPTAGSSNPGQMPGVGGTNSGGPVASGGQSPTEGGTPGLPPPDVNCTPSNAKGGNACTMPCATTCGFHDLGEKACDCVSGVYVSCRCPRPWNYRGHTTAPTCDTPDGRTHWIDNNPCSVEWAQCIGTDPVAGVNPRGCLCLTDPVNGKLEWTCGSTNRWFLHE